MLSLPNLFPIALQLLESPLMAAHTNLRDQIEEAELFRIGYQKSQIAAIKKQYFSENPIKHFNVITSFNNLDFVSSEINGRQIETIPYEQFSSFVDDLSTAELRLKHSITVLTNNTINRIGLEKFAKIYSATPKTIYVLQDIDSHHWHELSLQIAALVDVYAPGHSGAFIVEGRINPHLVTGIPIGTTQWSYDFLSEHIPKLAVKQRLDEPFGMHSFYPRFKFRNQAVVTLAKHSSFTGLQNSADTTGFLGRSAEQRWDDWTRHKLHWIIPVAHDLPNRFFDALVTGGIPLAPKSLRSEIMQVGISDSEVCYYDGLDILEPSSFIKKALKKYDDLGGNEQSIERAINTFNKFHVNNIVDRLITSAVNLYHLA
jgi:hypothetical protein